MADKPDETQHIVMSVPHSGTRTLQTWLSEKRPHVIPPHSTRDQVGHWHFNFHPVYIQKFFLYAESKGDGRRAYIPIRNPYDIADSWQRRYGDATDKTAKEMTAALHLMIKCIDEHADHIEVFKIEDLPRIRGHGPSPEGWEGIDNHTRLRDLRWWVQQYPEVEGFYRAYYTAEELWWL